MPPAVPAAVEFADDLDILSRDEISSRSRSNLAATIASLTRSVELVERRPRLREVPEAGIEILEVMTPDELATSCPPASHELLIDGTENGGLVIRSSGTSGRRKFMYHSWKYTDRVNFLGARGIRRLLGGRTWKIANCLKPARLNGAFGFVEQVTRLLPAYTFPIGSDVGTAETLDVIDEHRIEILVAGPRLAGDLARAADGKRLATLRYVLYIGASMDDVDRRAIAALDGEPVVRSLAYSTSETGPIGYQCAHLGDDRHHVHEDAVLVEIVDPATGRPVPDGVPGDVVVTSLTDSGMAFLRYRIGDRAVLRPLSESPCECGSRTRVLQLLGRVAEVVTVNTTTFSADLLATTLSTAGLTDPAGWQLQLFRRGTTHEIRLLVAPAAPPAAELLAALRATYAFREVIDDPHCAGMSIRHVTKTEFATNQVGKVPRIHVVGHNGPALSP